MRIIDWSSDVCSSDLRSVSCLDSVQIGVDDLALCVGLQLLRVERTAEKRALLCPGQIFVEKVDGESKLEGNFPSHRLRRHYGDPLVPIRVLVSRLHHDVGKLVQAD